VRGPGSAKLAESRDSGCRIARFEAPDPRRASDATSVHACHRPLHTPFTSTHSLFATMDTRQTNRGHSYALWCAAHRGARL
jgi:hypothetical protein